MEKITQDVAYLVFDIESVVDKQLVADIKYPGENLTAAEALSRFTDERLAETGSDFIPSSLHIPASIAVAKVSSDFSLIDLVGLDEPQFRPEVMTEKFWKGWELYQQPTLVTFNGRAFDIPVLELAAFRYGISLPRWFAESGRSYEQPRNRFNSRSHIDLMELLTNFGACRLHGGLNLAARILKKPGKMDVTGADVQTLFEEGRLAEIYDYCRCDVLDTYFVFLRTRLLLGQIDRFQEKELVNSACQWIGDNVSSSKILTNYLQICRDGLSGHIAQ